MKKLLCLLFTSALFNPSFAMEGSPFITEVDPKSLTMNDQEIPKIKTFIAKYNESLEQLKSQFSEKIDWDKEYQSIKATYQEIGVTGERDFEKDFQEYQKSHPKIDESSSIIKLREAYDHATCFLWAIEAADEKIDPAFHLIIQLQARNVINAITKSFIATGVSLEQVRKQEAAVEESILRLREKKTFINELRLKRIFLEHIENIIKNHHT